MSYRLHSYSPFFFIFPLFFSSISMAVLETIDTKYPGCPSYKCSGTIIGYPFWVISNQTYTGQFCGYHGLGINCSDLEGTDRPTIYLKNDLYHVRNITNTSIILSYNHFPVNNTIPLVDQCLKVNRTIELENLPFNFSNNNLNLSFHFNCSRPPPPDYATPIPCMNSVSNRSYVNVIHDNYERFDDWDCNEIVTTVFDYATLWKTTLSWRDYASALIYGFELNGQRPDDEDCDKCEESDGRCGFRHANNTRQFLCFCSDGTITTNNHCKKGNKINWTRKLAIGVSGVLATLFMVVVYCIMKPSSTNCVAAFKHKTEDHKSVEAFVLHYGSLTTKRYKYVDIKKMTSSFQVKLGQGGFGTVFKGKLSDGRLVAVKVLNSSKASGQEFINEVASIGRTSHVNIVSLIGFCFEYEKRALVYEFMPNGSLEKFIHSHVSIKTSDQQMRVDKLYKIALGIARGLDYLHRGCNTRILHLDIKPHNILLDEDFCPKIADFGLAKLHSRKDSIVSMLEARGTIGYIAPEVFNRNFGGVSHKSDVYSYGMLILEMVGGRKNVDAGVGSGHTSEIYFPYWIYSRLKSDEYLLDSITTAEENDHARKMTIVGLWCIQTDPNQRPSINEAIEMLEGSMDALRVPPRPCFSSPPRLPASTLNTSELESGSNLDPNYS
uniref:LEAF RUST 10 DISEASE-RESISTANCE LOCUS RECEPTOR-LIKE PROTEIN KINASE-like 2.1 n=1 Tax=Erigeron canadensis TaxID=72917 RepID=UPI001CB8CAD0|nr:LEAF RUST 10 DISEASE-RESISTANCE LOCUS RECEPTOR-LIKE PROTEIN KINASE-like 2.1 [Erigeron canadensis]